LDHTIAIPIWTLLLAVLAWGITQGVTMWGASYVVKRARHESVTQKDEVVEHFTRELQSMREELSTSKSEIPAMPDIAPLEAKIQGIDNALGAKFQELDGVLEGLPNRIRMGIMSEKGVETKALYRAATEGEEELETYMADNMDASEIAMAKIEAIEPNEDWQGKHPLGAMLVEAGKEFMRAKMDEARGVVTLSPVGKRRRGFR